MRIKYKVFIVLFMIVMILFSSGITYSIFNSTAALITENKKIAKFVFNASKVDLIEIPLVDMYPGSVEEYLFSVTNASQETISNITIEYQITIKTYHFMPLVIELISIEDDKEILIMNCNETYSRNSSNELVCNSSTLTMDYDAEVLNNYKLKVSFPEEYNTEEYSDLVDYIDLEISSWQKIGEKK